MDASARLTHYHGKQKTTDMEITKTTNTETTRKTDTGTEKTNTENKETTDTVEKKLPRKQQRNRHEDSKEDHHGRQ